jgi:hypothetical protein
MLPVVTWAMAAVPASARKRNKAPGADAKTFVLLLGMDE